MADVHARCLEEINRIYRRLDVQFDHTLGESFYNPMLPGVVKDLLEKGIARRAKGRSSFRGENAAPSLIRKTRRRLHLHHDRPGHDPVSDQGMEPGSDPLRRRFPPEGAFHQSVRRRPALGLYRRSLEHVSFGAVLSKDGKPLKTREGGVPELNELLDDAVRRAAQVYDAARARSDRAGEDAPELSQETLRTIDEVVGLGAVKYADLSQNRTSDYKFDPDKMMAMDGNTGTYMQYAYARNRSIFRKGDVDPVSLRHKPAAVILERPEERALALQLLRFEESLTFAAAEYKPSFVTAYLWDLAKTYSGFFQNCPVLKAETPELRQSRLLLCDLTARVIQRGLDLLGIRTVERM